MEEHRHIETAAPGAAQQRVQTLAHATLHALERAGLREEITALRARVLDRPCEDVCEILQGADDGLQLVFKPIIEVLLYEIKHVARAPHTSDEDRRVRIAWAMSMAGV